MPGSAWLGTAATLVLSGCWLRQAIATEASLVVEPVIRKRRQERSGREWAFTPEPLLSLLLQF
jgi:hypothetical protein